MRSLRRATFILVPLAILLLPVAIYAADRGTSGDEIARNVSIASVPVGGLNVADATLAVEAYENDLVRSTGRFVVNGREFGLPAGSVGLDADVAAAVDRAMAARRSDGPAGNFVSWVRSFSSTLTVPLEVRFDDDEVSAVLDYWEREAIPNPAFDGSVAYIEGEGVVVRYPEAGEMIDRSSAVPLIEQALAMGSTAPVELPIRRQEPTLTSAQLDAAAAEMADVISDPITLRARDVSFRATFFPDQLAAAVIARVTQDGSAIDVTFDPDVVAAILEPRRGEFEIPPVSARFDIDLETDEVTVIPGRNGTLLDMDGLIAEMKRAALGDGTGTFPLHVGAEPEFTTEEAMQISALEPLGGFTTSHPAGQPRVTNIHQMADDVDGAIVMPGEVFSINEHVGERTEAKGYVAAPAVINGVPYCCDHPANIGGGVSQFGTTLFNAVFFSCLEDVEHRPHSLYFSRYPMGREATLGVPGPDVKFRNNTDQPVVIKTAYTDTTLTVKMYGDNGGLTCDSVTHDPEDVVPFEQEFVADTEDELMPGERRQERNGIDGFLVRVDRIVTAPDGAQTTDMNLVWRYRPLSELWTVHPCEVTGEPVHCPVQVANVVGATWTEALATLEAQGLLAARDDLSVDDPGRDQVVLEQDPPAGDWLDEGTTVRLTVGVYQES